MRRHLVLVVASALAWVAPTARADWIFRPSHYTHDPQSGQRVAQFAPKAPAYVRTDPTYQQSAYRHSRTTLRYGDSTDHLHIVETWGRGESIRPYGEWLYPYRAGATPFGPWGNPQGPWTLPFGAWVNPYGLGRFFPPWLPWGYGPLVPPISPPASPPEGGDSSASP